MGFGEVLRQFGVKVSLDFDSKKFEEAQSKVDKFAGKLRSFAFEASALTAGVFEFQNLFTSNARSLQNQADLLGINTEKLQEYEYAAKVAADANREDLVGSLQTLGDTMDKARAGDIAARQALEQIGGASGNTSLILGKLNDRTYKTTDAFRDLSQGIMNISKNSPQAASRLTEMTLGSTKLYNLMRQGPKAIDQLTAEGKKNFALNDSMIKQGAKMDIQMSKLWMTFRKFGYEIGFSVMKHLTPLITQFTKWFSVNKNLIASGINAFIDALADGLEFVWKAGVKVVEFLGPLIDKVGGINNAMRLLIGTFLAFKAISLAASFASMGTAILGFATTLVGVGPMIGAIGASIKGLAVSTVSFLGGLTAVVAAAAAGYEAGKALNDFIDSKTGGEGIGGKLYDFLHPDENKGFSNVTPSGGLGPSPGSGSSTPQENHFNTTNTIMMAPGTTAAGAAGIISKATVDSNEKMMIKAKQDAARSRKY